MGFPRRLGLTLNAYLADKSVEFKAHWFSDHCLERQLMRSRKGNRPGTNEIMILVHGLMWCLCLHAPQSCPADKQSMTLID